MTSEQGSLEVPALRHERSFFFLQLLKKLVEWFSCLLKSQIFFKVRLYTVGRKYCAISKCSKMKSLGLLLLFMELLQTYTFVFRQKCFAFLDKYIDFLGDVSEEWLQRVLCAIKFPHVISNERNSRPSRTCYWKRTEKINFSHLYLQVFGKWSRYSFTGN